MSGAGRLGDVEKTTTVNISGTLDLGGTTQTQATLNQAGTSTVTNGTINVGTYQLTGGTLEASATVSGTTAFGLRAGTVNGILDGAGALTKTTVGTVTLSGVNTYT